MDTNQKKSPKTQANLRRESLKSHIRHPYITGQKLQPSQEPAIKLENMKENKNADYKVETH